jgi:hypothetical protein
MSCPLTIPSVRSTFCVKPLDCNHFLMSTMTRAAMIVVGSADILVTCCAVVAFGGAQLPST